MLKRLKMLKKLYLRSQPSITPEKRQGQGDSAALIPEGQNAIFQSRCRLMRWSAA
jgi:hypothetical protein